MMDQLGSEPCSGEKANEAGSQKCGKDGVEAMFVTEYGKVFHVDQAKVKSVFVKKISVSGTLKGDVIDVTAVKRL